VNRRVKQLSMAALLALPAGTPAGERQSLAALREAVVAFVRAEHAAGAELEVFPDALDPRLRLAPCPRLLEAFWAPGSDAVGQTTVGIRCTGATPWKLYLPTRVKLLQPVVVAGRALARGQRIGPGDVRVERRDVGALRGDAIHDPARVAGYLLARAVPAGRVLEADLLEAPVLVERGRRVQMAVESRGMRITMAGAALEDGALGDTVRVRNPTSRRVVEGVVVAPGRVRLEIPAGGSAARPRLD